MTTPIKTGPEFHINTTTLNSQENPDVAVLSDGGYVSAWGSWHQDGSGYGIYAQRFNADGSKRGGEFHVSTYTTGDQNAPHITALHDGGFAIIWSDAGQDGDGGGVYGQRYAADGRANGGEFRINSHIAGDQWAQSIATLSYGHFVVVWTSYDQDGDSGGVYGQRFDGDGIRVGSEFLINTTTAHSQQFGSVAALFDGGFIVSWTSDDAAGNYTDIYAQRFNADGTANGGEFMVNTTTIYNQNLSVATGLANGGFVIAWSSGGSSAGSEDVYAQVYNSDGSLNGGQFRVNTTTWDNQTSPRISALSDGGFVITFASLHQDSYVWEYNIFGQRYNADGSANGSEFNINTYVPHTQFGGNVDGFSGGGFVTAWQSQYQEDAAHPSTVDYGIYGQLFSYASGPFTSGDDVVVLSGPGQTVNALAGNDTVTGADFAAGSDIIYGNDGNDILMGMAGNDTLIGDGDDDTLEGGQGDDTLVGGTGNDTASYQHATAGVASYLMYTGLDTGGAGIDTLTGIENLTGSDHDDRLAGDASDNVLTGNSGNDVLKGKGGNDTFFGGFGDDKIVGGAGNDVMYGGAGNDVLIALAGLDTLNGGDNDDSLYGGKDDDILNGDTGIDNIRGNLGADQLSGGDNSDTLRGGGQNDILNGDGGNDYLFGENHSDTLFGGAGNDSMTGGTGSGVFDGYTDTFIYKDTADGGGGYDRIKDFENGIDLIDLQSFSFADFAAVQGISSNTGTGLRINFGGGDVLYVENFQYADFDAGDVVL